MNHINELEFKEQILNTHTLHPFVQQLRSLSFIKILLVMVVLGLLLLIALFILCSVYKGAASFCTNQVLIITALK